MDEKLYKKMKHIGACSLVIGIVTIAVAVGTGVVMIINVYIITRISIAVYGK